jgi:hypothetical protein
MGAVSFTVTTAMKPSGIAGFVTTGMSKYRAFSLMRNL